MKKLAKAILKKNFGEYFKSALNIIKLDRRSILEISEDENATKLAIVIALILAFISSLLLLLIYKDMYFGIAQFLPKISLWYNLIIVPIFSLMMLFLWTGILHLASKIFRSSGNYIGLFRVFGFASLLSIFTWIPLLGVIISLWSFVITVVSISEVEKLTTGKAFFVLLIPFIILIGIGIIAGLIIGLYLIR